MWKLLPTFSRQILGIGTNRKFCLTPQLRQFLSESFKLENVWNTRLQSPILKKINVNDLFYELDNQFQHFAYASALDIDLFVNAVQDESNFDEIEDVVHKLRLSPEAINILPSTQHALIRLYMKFNMTDDLIRILDDRLNYGIFSDDYCSLLMMDTFIKKGNFRDAAKVSTFNMLQEDIRHPLLKYMALYSCHKYLENPVPWNSEENANNEEEEDDGEEVKVRVKYIRNPYFDDHFDLVDPNHLIGKTMTYIGSEVNDPLGRTYKLIGLLLHEKFDGARDYIKSLLASTEKPVFIKDGLTFSVKILDGKIQGTGNEKDDVQAICKELITSLSSLTDPQLVVEGNLLNMVEETIKDLVVKEERNEIKKQVEVYSTWEKNRERLLVEQIAKLNREKQLVEVQRQKEFLKEKEDELFFFDNEHKLDLIIEEKERLKAAQIERLRRFVEEKQKKNPPSKQRKIEKPKVEPPLESFFDENIPSKLIKTKL